MTQGEVHCTEVKDELVLCSLLALVICNGVSIGRRKFVSCPCCVSLSHNASEHKFKQKGKKRGSLINALVLLLMSILVLMMHETLKQVLSGFHLCFLPHRKLIPP